MHLFVPVLNQHFTGQGTLYINPCGSDLVLGSSDSYATHPGKTPGRCALLCEEEDHCIGYSMPHCSLLHSVGDRCEVVVDGGDDELLLKQDILQVKLCFYSLYNIMVFVFILKRHKNHI